MDIYVVRPDGVDLRRLTTETVPPLGTNEAGDFGAAFPSWTRDGRITFTRLPMPPDTEFQLWVIDPDGTDATLLDFDDPAALTTLGCVTCTYPGPRGAQSAEFRLLGPGAMKGRWAALHGVAGRQHVEGPVRIHERSTFVVDDDGTIRVDHSDIDVMGCP